MKTVSMLGVLLVVAVGFGFMAPNPVASQSPINAFFNDLAGFNTAAGSPPVVIGFDDISANTDITGVTVSGVTFNLGNPSIPSAPLFVVPGNETFTPSGFTDVVDPETNKLFPTSPENVLSPGGRELAPGPNPSLEDDSLRLTFESPVAAVGFDILFQQLDQESFVGITVLSPDGEVLFSGSPIPTGSAVSQGPGGAVFAGFVSDSPNIKEIVVTEFDDNNNFPDSNIGYDSLRFAVSLKPRSSCVVYAVDNQEGGKSQLLAIDLRGKKIYPVGQGQSNQNIAGLAFNQFTQTLYAIAGQGSSLPGQLYVVDHNAGIFFPVGDTGFDEVKGLAFHPTAATLWSWVKGIGLIEIDPATATSTIRHAANMDIEGLVWNNDGTALYLTEGQSLWAYDPGENTLEKIDGNLPGGTKALEIRPDGLLLGSRADEQNIHLFAYDVTTQQVVMNAQLESQANIQAIAWLAACGNPSPGGEADLIQNVTVDKVQVCEGESLLVTVTAKHPESPRNPVDISINGDWGSSRYVQFTGAPGERLIHVTAATPEKYIDLWEGQVEVIACDASQVFPFLTARANPFHELTVDLDIVNANEFSAQNPTYVWEFGDGQTEQTTVPFVSHDYTDAIDINQLYTVFQARVTVQREGQPDISTPKTLTLWNMYAFNKERGIIQPRLKVNEQMELTGEKYAGTYTIRNLEVEPIEFTSRQLEYQFCDPELSSQPLTPEAIQLVVEGQQEVAQQVEVLASSIPADVCGIAVYLIGQTASQMAGYVSLYFDVQDNFLMTQPITDPAMLQLLNDIVARGLVADQDHITDEDLYRLSRAGEIVFPPPVTLSGSTTGRIQSSATQGNDAIPAGSSDIIGQPCKPGDPPPQPGVTCQATGEWTLVPPHIANARKGDILLSAGCALIGDLLRQVSPPQRYSHTGIMTRNYYEVRHSTAIEKRYQDYPVGVFDEPTDGFRIDVMRYGWPGTITQSINEAYNGQYLVDPEKRNTYHTTGFSATRVRCGGDLSITDPRVVKPPPGHDPSIRSRLEAAADIAKTINGHYRFFAYTNAAISEDPRFNAPAEAGWANGTVPTVCTSFIWTALRKAGINHIEGPKLEPDDFENGAELDSSTLDGLYLYTEAERKAGVQWLYSHTYDLAAEEGGLLGALTNPGTDARNDIAYQMANCFANDSCDPDSEAWQNPGVGRALSPDNILLFWDAPETGGVYGYNEPLVYRSGDRRPVYRWQASPGVGTIAGRVLESNKPVQGASVTIHGLGIEMFTDANGQFRNDLIPAGTYEIEAIKFLKDRFYSARKTVTINPGEITNVELILEPPPASFRRVVVQGSMFIRDHDWPDPDDTGSFSFFREALVDPYKTSGFIRIDECVDEVKVRLDLAIHLRKDNGINVIGGAVMWEWTNCNPPTNQVEDDESVTTYGIAADTSKSYNVRLRGDGEADIDFMIYNGGR